MEDRTTVSISREAKKYLGLLCEIRGLSQGKVIDALVRAEATNYDPDQDQAKTATLDYENRTITTVTVSGRSWVVPLSSRSWELFRDYSWMRPADFSFSEEEKG